MSVWKCLNFSGSLRSGSVNVKLAHAATKVLVELGAQTTYISLEDFPMPIYDEDLKSEKGVPDSVTKLARLMATHDGLFITSPEYNASVTPLLKNTIDWLSVLRDAPKPFAGVTVALGAASPGGFGGIRGLYHLRAILMNVGAQIITDQAAVPRAMEAFGEDGMLKDERSMSMLKTTCRSLLEMSVDGRGRE
ncbi:MAG: NAD(P)H-dependent oxidoreductase [Pseudomonadota bacterium]